MGNRQRVGRDTMPRVLLLLVVGLGTVALLLGVGRVAKALTQVEWFHVRTVELEGNRYLGQEEAMAHLSLSSQRSVWDDLEPVEARLRSHPLVLEARVRRRPPSTLILTVTERDPVAFLPTPVLAPVDRDGRRLPIDPSEHPLDLPLLQAGTEGWNGAGTGGTVSPGAPDGEGGDGTLTPVQLRILAGEVSRLGALEPDVAASLSDAALDRWGDVILRLSEPAVEIRYRPPLAPGRLREGLQVLGDALDRAPERRPRAVDLRFEDQVVVRYTPPTPR
jgi:hypothetical protein